MISKAEQQLVTKSQDKDQLFTMLLSDVFSHKRFGSKPPKDFSIDSLSDMMRLIDQLDEDCRLEREGLDWTVTLGGSKAKKIASVKSPSLEMGIAKAIIIYVRKYL